MTITLSAVLLLYGSLVAFILLLLLINIYHLSRNASLTLVSFSMTVAVFSLIAITLFATHWLLQNTDWQTPLFSTPGDISFPWNRDSF